jgi:hypothetical protein
MSIGLYSHQINAEPLHSNFSSNSNYCLTSSEPTSSLLQAYFMPTHNIFTKIFVLYSSCSLLLPNIDFYKHSDLTSVSSLTFSSININLKLKLILIIKITIIYSDFWINLSFDMKLFMQLLSIVLKTLQS